MATNGIPLQPGDFTNILKLFHSTVEQGQAMGLNVPELSLVAGMILAATCESDSMREQVERKVSSLELGEAIVDRIASEGPEVIPRIRDELAAMSKAIHARSKAHQQAQADATYNELLTKLRGGNNGR